MSAQIYAYLEAVKVGKKINYEAMTQKLVAAGYPAHEVARIFSAVKAGKTSYWVGINSQIAFDELRARFRPSTAPGRIGAALDGNSHRVGVSGTMLVLRSIDHPHPVVVTCDADQWTAPRQLGRTAVIVENLENFMHFAATSEFVSLIDRSGHDLSAEYIYGSGNQITSQLSSGFLKTFSRIGCLFDVDCGGLRMYAALRKLLPETPLEFLVPGDIESRLKSSKNTLNSFGRQEIVSYAGVSAVTDNLIRIMRTTSTVLEQESYLANPAGKEDLYEH